MFALGLVYALLKLVKAQGTPGGGVKSLEEVIPR